VLIKSILGERWAKAVEELFNPRLPNAFYSPPTKMPQFHIIYLGRLDLVGILRRLQQHNGHRKPADPIKQEPALVKVYRKRFWNRKSEKQSIFED
jgi:hypothetical protein